MRAKLFIYLLKYITILLLLYPITHLTCFDTPYAKYSLHIGFSFLMTTFFDAALKIINQDKQ